MNLADQFKACSIQDYCSKIFQLTSWLQNHHKLNFSYLHSPDHYTILFYLFYSFIGFTTKCLNLNKFQLYSTLWYIAFCLEVHLLEYTSIPNTKTLQTWKISKCINHFVLLWQICKEIGGPSLQELKEYFLENVVPFFKELAAAKQEPQSSEPSFKLLQREIA